MGILGGALIPLLLLAAVIAALAVYSRRVARRVEAELPPTGRLRRIAGGTIHFTDAGAQDAPPVLLIHGLAGNLRNFHALAPLLEKDHRVIAIDRPGSGWSTREDDALARLPEQAAMIAAFIEAEGLVRPTVVGHSLGGALALALALDRPDLVGPLALLAPLTRYEPEPPPVFKGLDIASPALRRFIGAVLAVPVAERMADATLEAVFAPEPAPEDFGLAGGGFLGLRPEGFVCASADLIGAWDTIAAQSSRYGALTASGGVLFGEQDRILHPDRHGRPLKEAAPRLVFETLPDRGHMIPVTAPEDCADFIRRMEALARARVA